MFNKKYKKRILFIGIPDMAYICMDGLLANNFNIVGVMGPKKSHTSYLPFKDFVKFREQHFVEYDELDEPELIQQIKDLEVDIAVVCSFNYKLPKVFLNSTKDGVLNIHPSLLPKYRGGNPYSTVLINGETETGVTIHFMDEAFDTGDIVIQRKVPLIKQETMGTLFNRLNYIGMELLVATLHEYEKRKLPRKAQPQGEFVSGKGLKDEESFIDYSKSANDIERFIRALNPFIIASTNFRKTFMKVFQAEVVFDESIKKQAVGCIAKIDEDKIYISTGNGFIVPMVMQFGTYFVGDCKKFIELIKPKVGEEFK